MENQGPNFEWDSEKDLINIEKHNVSFALAQLAFVDPDRVILRDLNHSTSEEDRYFCFGMVKEHVLTVRFTRRGDKIRIFGAGYWRKGKKLYDEKN